MSGRQVHPAAVQPLRSFGRTGGRPLTDRQKGLLASDLPRLAIPPGSGPLHPGDLLPGYQEFWLEIGFGGAEHLLEQAARRPDVGFLGAEPFIEGVAKALAGIERAGLRNIRLWPDDVRPLIERLPDGSLSRVFILFPDPWPKRRHNKRRLVQAGLLKQLRAKMRAGGRVRFATDVRSYADEALLAFSQAGGFHWDATRAEHWRCPPADHVQTRYEVKGLGDCRPVWLDFTAGDESG